MKTEQEKDEVDELINKIDDLDPHEPGFSEALAGIENDAMAEMIMANRKKDYLKAARALSLLKDITIVKSMARGYRATMELVLCAHQIQSILLREVESPVLNERRGTDPA